MLKIDAAFWWMVNMYQILRLMTLINVDTGLTLRNFLNDELRDFMIQIDINKLPKFLFDYDTTESRKFSLYGIKSNLFVIYMLSSLIVIVATAFSLTFTLAILECMKKTKRRLKLMIAIATYLSLNLWIRGIFEFSLTLFITGILDMEALNLTKAGLSGLISGICLIIYILVIAFLVYKIFRFFRLNKHPDKWPKGLQELYDPLKPKIMSIITFNIAFLTKRLLLALILTLGSFIDGTTQLLLFVGVFFLSLLVSILMIRFSSKITTAIYYITELCCLGAFGLQNMYDNRENIKNLIGIDMTSTDVDYTIIVFIFIFSSSVMFLILIEAFIACKDLRKKRKENYRTDIKATKYIASTPMEEEKRQSKL